MLIINKGIIQPLQQGSGAASQAKLRLLLSSYKIRHWTILLLQKASIGFPIQKYREYQ